MTSTSIPRHSGPSFGSDLRQTLTSERIKITTIRSNLAVIAITIVMSAGASWAAATFVTDQVLNVAGLFSFPTLFTVVLAAIAGILNFTTEAEHGTLGLSIAAKPARGNLVLAKIFSAASFGAALGATGLAASTLGAMISGIEIGDTSTMLPTVGWAILFTSLASALGLGVGMIARTSAAGISGLLVWWLVVESLIDVLANASWTRFLPFAAGNRLLNTESGDAETLAALMPRPTAALVFSGYTAVVLLIGVALFFRRDAA